MLLHFHRIEKRNRQSTSWMLTFLLLALCVAVNAIDEKSVTETKSVQPSTATKSATARDEIYIDDEGLEGSGGRGEIHDDLEKEPDYSGSGFGPDDEDSSSNHHSSTTHHTSSSSGTGSGTSGNSISRQDTNRKDTTRVTDYESGSGDGTNDPSIEDDNEKEKPNTPEDRYEDIDGKDHDNDDDDGLYTDVTEVIDQSEHDVMIPIHRSGGESGLGNQEAGKSNNNDNDQNTDQTRNQPTDNTNSGGNEVLIMNKNEDKAASFFAQPGILAAVIGGAVVGLLCAILVVMFIVYRMRKKDEGSYALDEPKRSPAVNSYAKNANNREFYA